MLHACVRKFDVTVTVANFLGSERGLIFFLFPFFLSLLPSPSTSPAGVQTWTPPPGGELPAQGRAAARPQCRAARRRAPDSLSPPTSPSPTPLSLSSAPLPLSSAPPPPTLFLQHLQLSSPALPRPLRKPQPQL